MKKLVRRVRTIAPFLILTGCGEQAFLKRSEVKGTLGPTREADLNSTQTATAYQGDSETASADVETSVASEPVAIGGAYLTCGYQKPHVQYSDSWALTCQLDGMPPLAEQGVKGTFQKLDASGQAVPLKIEAFDRSSLSWTLAETSASVPFLNMSAQIEIEGWPRLDMKAKVQTPAPLNLSLNYWLAYEPNNGGSSGQLENCAEFLSTSMMALFPPQVIQASGPMARLNDQPCSKQVPFLCRHIAANTGAKWIVAGKGAYLEYPSACPAGYQFSIPLTEPEHVEVAALLDGMPIPATGGVEVWVAADDIDKEGDFRIRWR